jgi:hypothetical protein
VACPVVLKEDRGHTQRGTADQCTPSPGRGSPFPIETTNDTGARSSQPDRAGNGKKHQDIILEMTILTVADIYNGDLEKNVSFNGFRLEEFSENKLETQSPLHWYWNFFSFDGFIKIGYKFSTFNRNYVLRFKTLFS